MRTLLLLSCAIVLAACTTPDVSKFQTASGQIADLTKTESAAMLSRFNGWKETYGNACYDATYLRFEQLAPDADVQEEDKKKTQLQASLETFSSNARLVTAGITGYSGALASLVAEADKSEDNAKRLTGSLTTMISGLLPAAGLAEGTIGIVSTVLAEAEKAHIAGTAGTIVTQAQPAVSCAIEAASLVYDIPPPQNSDGADAAKQDAEKKKQPKPKAGLQFELATDLGAIEQELNICTVGLAQITLLEQVEEKLSEEIAITDAFGETSQVSLLTAFYLERRSHDAGETSEIEYDRPNLDNEVEELLKQRRELSESMTTFERRADEIKSWVEERQKADIELALAWARWRDAHATMYRHVSQNEVERFFGATPPEVPVGCPAPTAEAAG